MTKDVSTVGTKPQIPELKVKVALEKLRGEVEVREPACRSAVLNKMI